MLEAAEADLALEAGFVHVKARQAFPEIGRQVRTRTNRVSGFAMAASVLSRAARRASSTQAAGRSEGVGPRVRIRLAPARGQQRTLWLPGASHAGGTQSSNPLCSSQSVSAVNPEAVSEKPRTLAAVCGWLGT